MTRKIESRGIDVPITGTGRSFRHQRTRGIRWLPVLLAALLPSCNDGSPVRPDAGSALEVAPVGLLVSEPVHGQQQTGDRATNTALGAGLTYVSADPGTFPGGVSATVANSELGESVSAAIREGGFDPVAIVGAPGDELEIRIRYDDGTSDGYRAIVPPRLPPRVVRTRPTKDAVAVQLNSRIVIVFSEPVERLTMTGENIRLSTDGAAVTATLTLDPLGLRATLLPDQQLEPEVTYTLEVTTDVTDLAGDALEEPLMLSFSTDQALQNQIVFTSASEEDWSAGIYDSEIYVMNTDGSGVTNLTHHPASDGEAAVSPDGTRILFTTDRDGNDEIYVMNADGSGLVNLTNDPAPDSRGVWSPDGMKIAFISSRGDEGGCAGGLTTVLWPCPDIFVMNADGSDQINLTNAPLDKDSYPVWSPDGTKIAFASNRAEPDSVPGSRNYEDIFVMDEDGSNVVKLTDIEGPMNYGYWPSWSPDGTKIAFTGGPGPWGIWVMNADGSNPVRLTPEVAEGTVYSNAVWPSWSPDGSRIAFRACQLSDNCVNQEVFVMNADGSNPVNLTKRPGFNDAIGSPQAWSPRR